MARKTAMIAFEDEEKKALKAVSEPKVINAVVKPLTDMMRENANAVKRVASAQVVQLDEVQEAQGKSRDLRRVLEQLPDSEAKSILMERLDEVARVLNDAAELGD